MNSCELEVITYVELNEEGEFIKQITNVWDKIVMAMMIYLSMHCSTLMRIVIGNEMNGVYSTLRDVGG